MKVFYFLIMLCLSLSMYGRRNANYKKPDLEAVKFAYSILQVYYPADELCVSDSVYDLDWPLFSDIVDDKTKQNLVSYRAEKNYVYSAPVRSKKLAALFGTSKNKGCQCKYLVKFSEPYKSMIRCDVMPTDRHTDIRGTTPTTAFLFRYDETGDIYQISVADVDTD